MTIEGVWPSSAEVKKKKNQKCRYNRGMNMLKASQSQADWQRKENKSMKERERSRGEKRICDWVSSTLLQTVHCFFIPPDIKAPSFLLWGRKCYGAMAHFVTHIIWISAPLYFHKSCHAKKDRRETDRERERGTAWAVKKRSREGGKRPQKNEELNIRGWRGPREEAVIWDLFNSEWMAATCVCVCVCTYVSAYVHVCDKDI